MEMEAEEEVEEENQQEETDTFALHHDHNIPKCIPEHAPYTLFCA